MPLIKNNIQDFYENDRLPGLTVYQKTRESACSLHRHLEYEIVLVLGGQYESLTDKSSYQIDAGDILFINSMELHTFSTLTDGELAILHLHPETFPIPEDLKTALFLFPPSACLKKETGSKLYCCIAGLILEIKKEYDSTLLLKGPSAVTYVSRLFIELCRSYLYDIEKFENTSIAKRQKYSETLFITCHYINQNYKENLTLERVAEFAGFSKFHFSRLFKQFTGMTFQEYLNRFRIKKAQELLAYSVLPMTEVAVEAGFLSLSNFNRAFRQSLQCSPSAFRNLYGQE